MAYPTGMLSLTLQDIDRRAASLKAYCQRASDSMLAGNIGSATVFDLFIRLKGDRAVFSAAASVPGLADYAKIQKNSPNLDVVAEFTSMLSAIDGVTTWISTNFPKDGSGFLLAQTWGANGPVDRTFAPAVTAGLRTQLATLIGSIS